MQEYLKKICRKIAKPELPSTKTRILSSIIALPFAFFLVRVKGLSIFWSGVVTLAFAVFFILSFLFEFRSNKKSEKFKEDVESGRYYSQDKWREKYLNYLNHHGFDKIKGSSMKSDLAGRFRKPSSFIMIAVSIIFLVACFAPDLPVDAIAGFIIGATVFFIWGMYSLNSAPVRKFMKHYADEINEIAESYMNGRLLTFKRNWSDKYVCNGINIGRKYTVVYNKSKITAVKNADIQLVHRYIKHTKYYCNSIYAGIKNTFHLDIILHTKRGKLTIELNEFQTQMAIEEYHSYGIPTTFEGDVVPDKNISISV